MEYLHQSQIWAGRLPGIRCFASEKLDGHRAFWDGGISRGVLKSDVPWANTVKDARYREAPVATGLWSRYGHCIQAPSWWLDSLPVGICLDGELWAGRGSRQRLSSVVKRSDPGIGGDWRWVEYICWDALGLGDFTVSRTITKPGYYGLSISSSAAEAWIRSRGGEVCLKGWSHEKAWEQIPPSGPVRRTERTLVTTVGEVDAMATSVAEAGGEGLVLRWAGDIWSPHRSRGSLKVKPRSDSEAVVIAVTPGAGKHVGRLGALVVRWLHGRTFSLGTGLSDHDRERGADWWIGKVVTFGYRGLTRDGLPVEGSYLRVREPGWD